MTILEMIAQWRKGCANSMEADGTQTRRPELCTECTRALIDAIERKEREKQISICRDLNPNG